MVKHIFYYNHNYMNKKAIKQLLLILVKIKKLFLLRTIFKEKNILSPFYFYILN